MQEISLGIRHAPVVMENHSDHKSRYQIPCFFALSLFAWLIWIPQAAREFGVLQWAPSLQSPLNALTVWSPGLAAMFLAYRETGKTGIGELFRSLARWRVEVRWYAIALLLEPCKWLVAYAIDSTMGRELQLGPALLQNAFGTSAAFMIPVAAIFTLPNALGEELGWRAFALPRLQSRHGPLAASVIIGLFWGLWHVPAWLAWNSSDPTVIPIAAIAVNMVPASVIFTWLYNRSAGSLLIVVLYHASVANKGYFLPKLPTFTETILLWVLAIAVVIAKGLSVETAKKPSVTGGRAASS